jgi:hypothetical protein
MTSPAKMGDVVKRDIISPIELNTVSGPSWREPSASQPSRIEDTLEKRMGDVIGCGIV